MARCAKCGAPLAYEGAKCGACAARATGENPPQGFEPEFGDDPDAEVTCPRCGAVLPGEGATCNACAIRDRFAERDRLRAQAAEALEEERRRTAEARQQADAERQQQVYEANTGLGRCPQCGSTNVTHVRQTETDTGAQAAFAGCMCCCIAWPLALLAPFLFRGKATYGHCNHCGHEWPL